jgi:vitamin B12 transporter
MHLLRLAGLAASLATLGTPAQTLPVVSAASPLLVTATRSMEGSPTLREAVVITRADLDAAGSLSLGEVLERRAGVELRATGGPGQPQGLFLRGAGTAQTLILVDGLRVGSATVGTTSIEHIPIELVERIEVVKGPMSSLYGSDAIGGVVQIFTRGKAVPHLFANAAYGSHTDRRISAGVTAADGDTAASLSLGARKVEARSATNPRATFSFDPDRDPYENAFMNARLSRRLWQGEMVALDAFASRSRTRFDAGLPFEGPPQDDRNDQTLSGVRISSSNEFARGWTSRLTLGHARDRLVTRGLYPSEFETRQDQAAWIHEVATAVGAVNAGIETLRQKVGPQGQFTREKRDTNSAFAGIREAWGGHRLEASIRRDDDDQFGRRDTGSASYGIDWQDVARVSVTVAHGFRSPTFFDLYAPSSDFYRSNPFLRPEKSRSREVALRSLSGGALQWRIAAYENRIDDLIVFVAPTVENVGRAEIRGLEASVRLSYWGARWTASATSQDPRDDTTGLRLPGRARHFGSLEIERDFGNLRATLSAHGSGDRYDRPGENDRLPGYATFDARLRYAIDKRWSVELSGTNLADKRRETSVGYDAPRRSIMLGLRLEAF